MSELRNIAFFLPLVVISISATIYGVIVEHEEWSEFSEIHDCVDVSHIKGTMSTVTTIGTNGHVGVGFVGDSGKTVYRCNDDKTYVR